MVASKRQIFLDSRISLIHGFRTCLSYRSSIGFTGKQHRYPSEKFRQVKVVITADGTCLRFINGLGIAVRKYRGIRRLQASQETVCTVHCTITHPPCSLQGTLIGFPGMTLPFRIPTGSLTVHRRMVGSKYLRLESPCFVITGTVLVRIKGIIKSVQSGKDILLRFKHEICRKNIVMIHFQIIVTRRYGA